MRLDQGGLEANAARGGIDVGASVLQHRARLVVQEVDADLLQHGERGLMDRFELVARDKFERRERRLRLARRAEAAPDPPPRSAVVGAGAVSCGGEPVVIKVPRVPSESADRDSPPG